MQGGECPAKTGPTCIGCRCKPRLASGAAMPENRGCVHWGCWRTARPQLPTLLQWLHCTLTRPDQDQTARSADPNWKVCPAALACCCPSVSSAQVLRCNAGSASAGPGLPLPGLLPAPHRVGRRRAGAEAVSGELRGFKAYDPVRSNCRGLERSYNLLWLVSQLRGQVVLRCMPCTTPPAGLLLLRRDWTATTCFVGGCRDDYP